MFPCPSGPSLCFHSATEKIRLFPSLWVVAQGDQLHGVQNDITLKKTIIIVGMWGSGGDAMRGHLIITYHLHEKEVATILFEWSSCTCNELMSLCRLSSAVIVLTQNKPFVFFFSYNYDEYSRQGFWRCRLISTINHVGPQGLVCCLHPKFSLFYRLNFYALAYYELSLLYDKKWEYRALNADSFQSFVCDCILSWHLLHVNRHVVCI